MKKIAAVSLAVALTGVCLVLFVVLSNRKEEKKEDTHSEQREYIAVLDDETEQVSFDFTLFMNMPKDENYMVSPFSLKMALAMAANGADGITRREIISALGIDELEKFNAYSQEFITDKNKNEKVEFNIANSIWFNTDYYNDASLSFSGEYKKVIEKYYKGSTGVINNANGAKTVNNWISKQTKNRINNVLTDKMTEENLSILVNTIYFKGDWAVPFKAENTRDDVFTDRNGNQKNTLFMEQTMDFSYYENDGFQMLAKPYMDEDIKFYIIMPKEGGMIDEDGFNDALSSMESKYVYLKLPKFKTEYLHVNLVEILKAMGVYTAFNPFEADFLGMYSKAPTDNIFISNILQKTFVEVDEKGTEAAAATVIFFAGGGISSEPVPINFICDRPFIYFIRDDSTGEILFMGEYAFVD